MNLDNSSCKIKASIHLSSRAILALASMQLQNGHAACTQSRLITTCWPCDSQLARRRFPVSIVTAVKQRQVLKRPAASLPSKGCSVPSCTCSSGTTQQPAFHRLEDASSRRAILSSIALCSAVPVLQARAGFGWDGSSAALGSCALGDEGADCRRQQLLKDKVEKSAYPSASAAQEGRPQATTLGIPIAEMKDAYTKETVALGDTVEKYFTLDPYDPERTKIVKSIKLDGSAWASKYARGGSARKLSARKFYIVVDALQGHITSNGFAPFPPAKAQVLQKNVEETKELLARGS